MAAGPRGPRRGALALAGVVVLALVGAVGLVATGVVGPGPSPVATASPVGSVGVASGAVSASALPSTSVASPSPAAPSSSGTSRPPGAPGFLRVDQVGYDVRLPASRRAFLIAPVSAVGATFEIHDASGLVVFGGAIPTTSLGAWSPTFGFVYPIDFGYVALPGTYTIVADGPVSATSPAFRVDIAANLFAPLLSNALAFYEAQRDGPDVISTILDRKPAHLNDKAAFVYAQPTYNADGTQTTPTISAGVSAPQGVVSTRSAKSTFRTPATTP